MIDRFLLAAWDEAPPAMAFNASYATLLEECAARVGLLAAAKAAAEADGGPGAGEPPAAATAASLSTAAVELYVRAPALVNVLLNYKICAEHGLPLHPTVYYELTEARRYRVDYPLDSIERANRLFRDSIELARAAIRLEPDWEERARRFRESLPAEILDFVYEGGADKYTWRGSEPARIEALARRVSAAARIDIVVAAAHGAIMPGLLLAEKLGLPLYFIRFSMFKRRDETPIISLADEAALARWRGGHALLFDEDVARGTTLGLFASRLSPLFRASSTACVIRHAGSLFKPDFAATTWYD